jgi:predicted RNA-binding Zn-ribbon protein involved in translation (DUF1610 family)
LGDNLEGLLAVLGLLLLIAMFVWPIWFLITMNSMNQNLRNIFKELRLQGDWLEIIAGSQATQEESGQTDDEPEAGEQWWCPNCKDSYIRGKSDQCTWCRQIGHPYE